MPGLPERAVLAWLRRVAPPGWIDSMEGDFNEERGSGAMRARALIQMTAVAGRFTIDALAGRLRRPRRMRGLFMHVFTDIRQAVRALGRSPGFSLVAVLTLALAIGANTAIYSALSALVLQPLPFKDGDRFVYLWHRNTQMSGLMLAPPPAAIDQWRQAAHVFERIESYTSRSLVMTGTGEPEAFNVSLLEPSTLRTFGMQPILGRPLVDADQAPGAPPVVLISHSLWTSRFGSARDVAGRTITLGDTPYTIVGVMPRTFRLPMGSDEMWAARKTDAPVDDSETAVAKLAPGVTAEQAQAALDAMPEVEDHKGWTGYIMNPADSNGTQIKSALFVLTGAVGLLLLIACVNVANLMLSRHSGRRREIAVRHALGASRMRIARYLMIESVVLAAAGGIAGLAVAAGAVSMMSALRPRNLDMLERLALDPSALAFTLAVTAATGLLFGVGPAIAASRAGLHDVLKSGGRSATGRQRIRAALTVAQVSLALMLLVGATLLLRSYAKLTAVDPGYEPAGIVSVKLSLPSSRYPAAEKARRHAFFEQLLASVQALPGVQSAAAGSGVPPDSGVGVARLEIDGRSDLPKRAGIFTGGYVTPSYFSTLGIPILEGRAFTADDAAGRDPVAIIGESLAQRYWPGGGALGARIRMGASGPWSTVVGVAGDVKALGLTGSDGHPQIYEPRAQAQPGFGAIVVRASGDPLALVPAIKAQVWAQDPLLPIGEVATAEQLLARSTSQSRFNLALLAAFAACGLLLAIVGVYGVTALFVGQRQREIGIRMALGATRGTVASLVFRQTSVMLAIALALGTLGALWLSRYLESLVFQTTTTDAASFALAAAAIAAASGAATLVPLRRATSVDPAIVLRAE